MRFKSFGLGLGVKCTYILEEGLGAGVVEPGVAQPVERRDRVEDILQISRLRAHVYSLGVDFRV